MQLRNSRARSGSKGHRGHYDIVACNAASTRPATRHACRVCLCGFVLHVKRLHTIVRDVPYDRNPIPKRCSSIFSVTPHLDTMRRGYSTDLGLVGIGEFRSLSRTYQFIGDIIKLSFYYIYIIYYYILKFCFFFLK